MAFPSPGLSKVLGCNSNVQLDCGCNEWYLKIKRYIQRIPVPVQELSGNGRKSTLVLQVCIDGQVAQPWSRHRRTHTGQQRCDVPSGEKPQRTRCQLGFPSKRRPRLFPWDCSELPVDSVVSGKENTHDTGCSSAGPLIMSFTPLPGCRSSPSLSEHNSLQIPIITVKFSSNCLVRYKMTREDTLAVSGAGSAIA